MSGTTTLSIVFVAGLFFVAAPAAAADYYVNAASGSDSNPGSDASPFKTINRAMSVAVSGDQIRVRPGAYNLTNGETFPITMKSGVKLFSTDGPLQTTINAQGANRRVFVCNGNSATTFIEGLRITGGLVVDDPAEGGAIHASNGDATRIIRNLIDNNEARGRDGTGTISRGAGNAFGGAVFIESSSTLLASNVIKGNDAIGGRGADASGLTPAENGGAAYGGGVFVRGNGQILNNTILHNRAQGGAGGSPSGDGGAAAGGAVRGLIVSSPSVMVPTVTNNILTSNVVVAGAGASGGVPPPIPAEDGALSGSAAITNNLFYVNTPSHGSTGTNAMVGINPLYHDGDPTHGSYQLRTSSPASGQGEVDAPTPPLDFNGTTRPRLPTIGAVEPTMIPLGLIMYKLQPSTKYTEIASFWFYTLNVDNTGCFARVYDGSTEIGGVSAPGNTSVGLSFSLRTLAVGDHSIYGVCDGNAVYAGSSTTPLSHPVFPAPTVTQLSSSASSPTFGQSVTFTMEVRSHIPADPTAPAIPTDGSVTLRDGDTVLMTSTNVVTSPFTTSALGAGTHEITATYTSTTGNFLTSTSETRTVTVFGGPTTTALISSQNPSPAGQPVTFTATVSSAAGTPYGDLVFKNGTAVLATSPLDASGMAQYTTAPLNAGSYPISAHYQGSGDDVFLPSSSATLDQSVQGSGAVRTWVSSTGVDSNNCSRSQPCRTFSAAAAVVNAAGEIVVLNSAGYGAVNLSDAVTILSPAGVHAAIAPTSGDAIVVSAGPNDVVILRGLYLNSQGADRGVVFGGGAALYVESCVFSGFETAIDFTGPADLFVQDSIVRSNEDGVKIQTSANALIERTRIEGNDQGIVPAFDVRVEVQQSVLARNATGLFSSGSKVQLDHCAVVGNQFGIVAEFLSTIGITDSLVAMNGTGIHARGIDTLVRAGGTTITANQTGIAIQPVSDGVFSFGTNRLAGNTTNGAFTGSIPLE